MSRVLASLPWVLQSTNDGVLTGLARTCDYDLRGKVEYDVIRYSIHDSKVPGPWKVYE